jgi:hypothetical protein
MEAGAFSIANLEIYMWHVFSILGVALLIAFGGYTMAKDKQAKIMSDIEESRRMIIKECNRKGAIYSDGVCQHVFAPICRRL